MSYNMGDVAAPTVPVERIADVIGSVAWCDLYVLQEVKSSEQMQALLSELRSRSGVDYRSVYSRRVRIALVSRFPVASPRTISPQASCPWCGALSAQVDLPGGRTTVVGVHLDAIAKPRDERGHVKLGFFRAIGLIAKEVVGRTPRSEGIREVLREVRGERRLVMAGDFNTIPFSRAIRLVERYYQDVLEEQPHYLKGSYWKVDMPIMPRVDFIFHGDVFRVEEAFVLPRSAGDHYPIVATLRP
jgi:endonuclease/exonuclease/phosphatase family metal-dependent hydrolase